MGPGDILERIVEQKRREIAALRSRADREEWRARAETHAAPPDFHAALARGPGMRVIAEIKRASPSAGVLRDPFDPADIARSYERGGAACLSVLTDEKFFQGSIRDLKTVRATVGLPLLRKDFILDPLQIWEARLAGASAVLFIAECLSPDQLTDLVNEAHRLQLAALVELYEPENLPAVLASGCRLVGVNNRNLRTFETRLSHTLDLIPKIPSDRIVVSESGIKTVEDVERLRKAGVKAILVGETFMRADDPGAKLAELLGVPLD